MTTQAHTETIPALRVEQGDLIATMYNGDATKYSEVFATRTEERDGLVWIVIEFSAPRYASTTRRFMTIPSGFPVMRKA